MKLDARRTWFQRRKDGKYCMQIIKWILWILRWLWCLIYCWLFWKPPTYEPAKWNDNNGIQFNNNCYNYACDMQTGTFAQPGRATGHEYAALACGDVLNGARSDGLVNLLSNQPCAHCSHQVALVVAPGFDFHWYRLDANGMWSHKPGSTSVRNVDNSNNPISDPRTADRGPYTDFCGFLCVCKCKVTIN
jgi:hypothetical protein